MSCGTLRLLLLADTHLGLPSTEFFSSFERALLPALRGEVDLVVHGGDVLFRSKVKPGLVLRAFAPLKRVADAGVPVIVVPGNHERSAIPYPLLAAHPGVHILDRPRTVALTARGTTVALSAFPNDRDSIRETFGDLLERTEWRRSSADIRLLVMHQTVEGASVGPVGYTFRSAPDVIPGRAIPAGFAAVLSGHIHRHQVLTADLRGRALASPVFYAGATARTSSAERDEAKGYVTMEIAPDSRGGRVAAWTFHELSPADAAPEDLRGSVTRSRVRVVGLSITIRKRSIAQPRDCLLLGQEQPRVQTSGDRNAFAQPVASKLFRQGVDEGYADPFCDFRKLASDQVVLHGRIGHGRRCHAEVLADQQSGVTEPAALCHDLPPIRERDLDRVEGTRHARVKVSVTAVERDFISRIGVGWRHRRVNRRGLFSSDERPCGARRLES